MLQVPYKIVLLLGFAAACGVTSPTETDTTNVRTSDRSLSHQAEKVIDLYAETLQSGTGDSLALTAESAADYRAFRRQLRKIISSSEYAFASDPDKLFPAIHDQLIDAMEAAGIDPSMQRVANFNAIPTLYSNVSDDEAEKMMTSTLRKVNFGDSNMEDYIKTFSSAADESYGQKLPRSLAAISTEFNLDIEKVLDSMARNVKSRSPAFIKKSIEGSLTVFTENNVPAAKAGRIRDTFRESVSSNADLNIDSLLVGIESYIGGTGNTNSSTSSTNSIVNRLSTIIQQLGGNGSLIIDFPSSRLDLTVGVAVSVDPANQTLQPTSGSTITGCEASAGLPAGLGLSAQCKITGTPTAEFAESTITFTVIDSSGATATDTLTIVVVGSRPALVYANDTINMAVGTAVSIAPGTGLVPGVGAAHSTCSVSPTLPAGLVIANNCLITGTPTADTAQAAYTVTYTNNHGYTATDLLTMRVYGAPSLNYANATLSLTVGSAMTPEDPTSGTFSHGTGVASSVCTISPALPAGLALNESTCIISGTPTTNQAATLHTITMTNLYGGITTDTITITVDGSTPSLAYASASLVTTVGTAITAENPSSGTFSAGAYATVTNCEASPALPTGLALNTTTCVISGTPTATQGATTHTITVTNSFLKTASDTIDITALGSLPSIDYGVSGTLSLATGSAITDQDPANTTFSAGAYATVTNCTSNVALPTGLNLNTSTCVISGTPSAVTSVTTYTITVTNSFGRTADATITMQTLDAATTDFSAATITGSFAGAKFESGSFQIDSLTDCSGNTATSANRNCGGTLTADWTPHYADLIVYFPMDDAVDVINGVTADTSNVSFSATAAKTGNNGLDLTDTSHQFLIPTDDAAFTIGTGDFTYSMWSYKQSETGAWARYFQWGDAAVSNYGYLYLQSGGSYHGGRLDFKSGGSSSNGPGNSDHNDMWNHFVITRTSGEMTFYVNGVASDTNTFSADLSTESIEGGKIALFGSTGYGGGTYTVNNNRNFGYVDDVAIWGVSLTEDEINRIYERGVARQGGMYTSRVFDAGSAQTWESLAWTSELPSGKPLPGDVDSDGAPDDDSESTTAYPGLASSTLQTSLEGSWSFEGSHTTWTTATNISDTSGNGVTVSPDDNTPMRGGMGKIGSAARQSSSGTLLTGSGAGAGTGLTIGGWINTRSVGGPTTPSWVFRFGWDYGNRLQANTHNLGYSYYHSDGFGNVPSYSYQYQFAGTGWRHLVAVDDSTLGYVKLYLDGVEVSTEDNVNSFGNTPSNVYMGERLVGGYDEMYMWSRGLSPTEVLQLYLRGALRVVMQVRSCTALDCSDDPAWVSHLGAPGANNDNQAFIGESQSSTLSSSATITFSDYAALQAQVGNRYFQYRMRLETDSSSYSPKVYSVTATP